MAALFQVGALLFLATLFGLIALVSFLVHLDQRRLRRAARGTPCAQCEAVLGEPAIALADELWAKHMSTLHERNPDAKFRVVRTVFAACPRCGARYAFDPKADRFRQVSVTLSFAQS